MKALLLSLCVLPSMLLAAVERKPVVYGVSPAFVSTSETLSGLEAVRKRLPEIKELGANVVWLMPLTPAADEEGGAGYDVMDYKTISANLGKPEDLKRLVADAHRQGLKVMLDVVLNHSSAYHPFVVDIQKQGKKSPYYEYYQHVKGPIVPYSDQLNSRKIGTENFYYYFWDELLNFNYDSPALRAYLLDVVSFWVKEYDIDGYRFDASWGPSSRYPGFYKMISSTLRKIKPDIILLAEDHAGYPAKYKSSRHVHLNGSGFDWAYDWDTSSVAVSKWAFQMDDDNWEETLFTWTDGRETSELFLKIVQTNMPLPGIKALRYIENNDSPSAMQVHNLRDAKWAAKVNYLLPGVPMLFYGQEAGSKREIHDLKGYDPRRKMASFNPKIWKFYHDLLKLRRESNALSLGQMKNLKRESPTEVSYDMVSGSEKVTVKLDFEHKEVFLNDKKLEL